MKRSLRGIAVAVGVIVALGSGVPAFGHGDTNPDGDPCDTFVRSGHEPGHHHSSGNDQDLGVVYVHNHGGHYAATSGLGYVEIVGGQGYAEPPGTNQGGYVQGEIDTGIVPVDGVPLDADFHFATFAGTHPDQPPFRERTCVSVAEVTIRV